jgi:hypothetical protein
MGYLVDTDDLEEVEAALIEEKAFLFDSPDSYSAGVQDAIAALEDRIGRPRS